MCDTNYTLRSSFLFWILSFIPNNIFRYIAPGTTLVCLLVYALHHNVPSVRLDRLDDAIIVTEEILAHTRAECMRDYISLAESETRFLGVKLSASRIHSNLLETRDMSWRIYLRSMVTIWLGLALCERDVRKLQTFMLLLIEEAHQRQLAAEIQESKQIVNEMLHSSSTSGT
ncbi:hypothetical protein DFH08DRAFT_866733 [Mycena albidolilacea]|uniref:Uncharacterized protein n=1 Tax=Mycena albidolilacea TaxID=1033008 RepID=A0AAD7A253_9AGAR|nr:hypothetical protein DFH08DRAFT_866733 [Mycena albidolilacea]